MAEIVAETKKGGNTVGCLSVLGDRALRNSLLGIAIPIALQNLLTYMTGMMDTARNQTAMSTPPKCVQSKP